MFYILIIGLAFFTPNEFIPTTFDSGGVTTGPITVPFIMALCAGLASSKKGKHTGEHSFGLVALCSIGPILSVILLNIYTSIAFDSGGVASGPMTSTFMLPFAVGTCEAIGGNIMTDAFGIVTMIAMTPLITIQVLVLLPPK